MGLIVYTYAVIYVCLLQQSYAINQADLIHCKKEETFGYGYKIIHHILETSIQNKTDLLMKFYVQANSNAHILLSPVPSPGFRTAVYEIVIGAGQNSFSDLRRMQKSLSKSSRNTDNILSKDEAMGFWIRQSLRTGLLEVGKEGDDVPFIFWKDLSPLNIQYFSFCTWSNVLGIWYYDCRKSNNTESEIVEEEMTDIKRLKKDIFTGYDRYVRPVLSDNQTTEVAIHLNAIHIDLIEEKSVISFNGIVTASWKDEKLQWTPSLYGNITKLQLTHHEAWQPEILLSNSAEKQTAILNDAPILLASDGLALYVGPTAFQTHCNIDLKNWPNDEHECEIKFGFYSEQQLLKLQLLYNGTSIAQQRTGTEWEITAINIQSNDVAPRFLRYEINTSLEDDSPTGLVMKIKLKRNENSYYILLGIPLIIASIMTILSFCISPFENYKLMYSCYAQIILAGFLIRTATILPAHQSSIPKLLASYTVGMMSVAISLIISITVTTMCRSKHFTPIPQSICRLLSSKYLKCLLFLPETDTKENYQYSHLDEHEKSHSRDKELLVEDDQRYWILLGILIDRIACMGYLVYVTTNLFIHS